MRDGGVVGRVYVVWRVEDPECSPEVLGVFEDCAMALGMVNACMVGNLRWTYRVPTQTEVFRADSDERVMVIEALPFTPREKP